MYVFLLVIVVFTCVGIWIGSGFAIVDRWSKIGVPVNIVSILIVICPIINTLLALYYVYPEYKKTLSKIFKNN